MNDDSYFLRRSFNFLFCMVKSSITLLKSSALLSMVYACCANAGCKSRVAKCSLRLSSLSDAGFEVLEFDLFRKNGGSSVQKS